MLFYIYSSTDKQLRDTHYVELLRLYVATLSDAIALLGSDPKRLCPRNLLDEYVRKVGRVMCLVIPSSIITVLSNDLNNVSNAQTVDDEYEKRITNFASDVIKYEYLLK